MRGATRAGKAFSYAIDGDATRLFVLRAGDIAGEPAAVFELPQRVSMALCGSLVP